MEKKRYFSVLVESYVALYAAVREVLLTFFSVSSEKFSDYNFARKFFFFFLVCAPLVFLGDQLFNFLETLHAISLFSRS